MKIYRYNIKRKDMIDTCLTFGDYRGERDLRKILLYIRIKLLFGLRKTAPFSN